MWGSLIWLLPLFPIKNLSPATYHYHFEFSQTCLVLLYCLPVVHNYYLFVHSLMNSTLWCKCLSSKAFSDCLCLPKSPLLFIILVPFTQFYYSVFAVCCSSLDLLTLLECESLNRVPNLYCLPQVKGSSLSIAKYLLSALGHQDIMSA